MLIRAAAAASLVRVSDVVFVLALAHMQELPTRSVAARLLQGGGAAQPPLPTDRFVRPTPIRREHEDRPEQPRRNGRPLRRYYVQRRDLRAVVRAVRRKAADHEHGRQHARPLQGSGGGQKLRHERRAGSVATRHQPIRVSRMECAAERRQKGQRDQRGLLRCRQPDGPENRRSSKSMDSGEKSMRECTLHPLLRARGRSLSLARPSHPPVPPIHCVKPNPVSNLRFFVYAPLGCAACATGAACAALPTPTPFTCGSASVFVSRLRRAAVLHGAPASV